MTAHRSITHQIEDEHDRHYLDRKAIRTARLTAGENAEWVSPEEKRNLAMGMIAGAVCVLCALIVAYVAITGIRAAISGSTMRPAACATLSAAECGEAVSRNPDF